MLAIRLQRTGRKGHAQFRMIVQESRRTPTSGNVVALLGQYDPHTKTANLNLEKAGFYLQHGAQPSDRVARLLNREGVKLPKWVQIVPNKTRMIRHPEKLRVNRPVEEVKEPEAAPEEPVVAADNESTETVAEASVSEVPTEDAAKAETAEEAVTTETQEAETTDSDDASEPDAKPAA